MFLNKIMVKLIEVYQKTPGDFHYRCKYHPTCSEYSKQAYLTRCFLIATLLTIYRLLRCNRFSKGGIDNVPLPPLAKKIVKRLDPDYFLKNFLPKHFKK
jgi:putative membrane protein insertion efficiency factor